MSDTVSKAALNHMIAGMAQGALIVQLVGDKSDDWALGVAETLAYIKHVIDTDALTDAEEATEELR